MLRMRPLRCGFAVIAAVRRTLRAPVERGRSSLRDRSFEMPLNLAQRNAWSLARTLMTIVIVFRIDGREYGVAEAQEFDGDPALIVREYDPFAR
jgi:hypothetical protein